MELLSDGKTWTRGELLAYDKETSLYLASVRFKRSKKNGHHSSSSSSSSFISIKSSEISSSKRLQKEAESLSDLQKCPQIIDFYGDELTYEENGSPVYNICLEYASGGTLLDMIVDSNSIGLPAYDVRRFTKSILLGLRYMHQNGYVHRNINPNSIQVFKSSSSLDVKIADFRCAKKLKTEIRNTYRIGSPLYLAPEAINRYEQGPPGDIWALGCTVVEMISGKPAWRCCNSELDVSEILQRIGSGVESPEIPDGISKEGRDFLRMCFVRYSNFRWTADMLLHHPFVASIE
ncbi:hypothetical protein ACHQM5_003372 [Ranunculus cassubicifolius]